MRKTAMVVIVVLLLVLAAASTVEVVRGQQGGDPSTLSRETQGENVREIVGPPQSDVPREPAIGFIDSPSATCYQPDPDLNECYINWYYLSVSAAPSYMITMTAFINEIGPLVHTQGFFQTSMYIPYNMLGKGIKVACGAPGSGGSPQMGKAYAYTIRARDSAGLASANYGTAYCPAYRP